MARKRQRARQVRRALELKFLATAAPSPGGPTTQQVFDTKVRNLAIRLNQNGRHTWIVNRQKIGHWPDMKTREARRIAAAGASEKAPGKNSITWRECIAHYMEHHPGQSGLGISRTIRQNCEYVEERFKMIDRPMVATTGDDLMEFMGYYLEKKSMFNRMRGTLKALWSYSIQIGRIEDPWPGVRIRKFPENPVQDFLSEEELPDLWAALDESRCAPLIGAYAELTYLWALRGCEALTFRWEWVSQTSLTVPRRKTQGRTSFPLWPEAREILGRLPRSRESPMVFPSPVDPSRSYSNLVKVLRDEMKKNWPGRRITPHTLRRSRCTHLRNAGFNDIEICALSGHSSATELATYLGAPPRVVLDQLAPSAVRRRLNTRRDNSVRIDDND